MKKQSGFSLVELMVVVMIIAVIVAIAIPNLLASRRNANQASAIQGLRTIHSAQVTYLAGPGNNNQYGDFTELSTNNDLLDDSWSASTVTKNTYTFELTTGNGIYCATASSVDTSAKDYGIDHSGVLMEGGNTTATCAVGVLGGVTIVAGS